MLKKANRRLWFSILILGISLFFTACGGGAGNSTKQPVPKKDRLNLVSLVKDKSGMKEAFWTLSVDDTIVVKVDGLDVAHHLIINATKDGGVSDEGIYVGTASLASTVDFSKLSGQGFNVAGGAGGSGIDGDAVITLEQFKADKYDEYGVAKDQLTLATLSRGNAMALGTFNMSGSGYFDITLNTKSGVSGSGQEQVQSVQPIQYKMMINGGQVRVYIPSLGLDREFKGVLTGEPLE